MLDLKKSKLPQAIKVGGVYYPIHTDFKYFLSFCEILKEKNTDYTVYDFMYINKKPINRAAGFAQLCNFMSPQEELPRNKEKESEEIVLDYAIDSAYIYAAFMEQYKIDLIDVKLHWHKFVALMRGLHDTELNRIISARLWKPSGKNGEYEKYQQKMYEAWKLPQPEDSEPDEALDDFLAQLKG